jgi:FkbM family methyltransferase
MKCFDEKGEYVNYTFHEKREQIDAKEYIHPDDKVLELGARYGGVSITINKILNDKTKHVAVEPDPIVWEALEKNRDSHDCKFQICKGAISDKPLQMNDGGYQGFGNYTSFSKEGNVKLFKVSDFNIDFNVLVVDNEGGLQSFYDENKDLFKNLRLIMYECDRPEASDYEYLEKEFRKLGFVKIPSDDYSHVSMVK